VLEEGDQMVRRRLEVFGEKEEIDGSVVDKRKTEL
jgi:hypothetical protein